MSLIFFDGFEGIPQVVKPGWNTTLNSVAGRVAGLAMQNSTAAGQSLTLPSTVNRLTMGFGHYIAATATSNLTIRTDAGATTHLVLVIPADGVPTLRLGSAAGTILATATGYTYTGATWRHVQIQATIADTGGRCIVKFDGVTYIDFTGDTRNGGTSTAIDTIGFIYGVSGNSARWDDLWICDEVDATATQGKPNNDFLGDLKVAVSIPTGAGASTQWTPSSAVANYTTVDEIPANTTDYVGTSVSGNRDLYDVTDLPTNTVDVYGVQVGIYAAKSDAGAASVKTIVRDSDGTVTTLGTNPMSTTYAGYTSAIKTKTAAGANLAVSDVNALQVGVELA
jgi:hypothetical protein